MCPPTLVYAKAGVVDEHGGREWLADHNECPYCHTKLQQLGSVHQPARNLVPVPDDEYERALCLNCGSRTARIDDSRPPLEYTKRIKCYFPRDVTPGRNCFLRVAICSGCSWWHVIENGDMCNDGFACIYTGILQTFDLSSAQVPVQVLEAELPKHLERIDGIHPNRMEDLLARILKGVYDGEVHQLGYTRDGGVDLVLLNGERQIAVQIKRRLNPETAEGVSGVREFLGAAAVRGDRELMYVTNAKRFSGQAHVTAERAVSKHIVESFELLSRDKLFALLRSHQPEPYWRSAIEAVVKGEYEMPQIPDPYRYTAPLNVSLT